ncbi:MAG TPA: hypothetical protein VL688_01780 [Verrucomicrobiae bacterium]|jgi:hypothetical protein|nr:hypothetical protein [Verrucomicrobiae bacterium]
MYFLPTKKWHPMQLGELIVSFFLFGIVLGSCHAETFHAYKNPFLIVAVIALVRVTYLYFFKD